MSVRAKEEQNVKRRVYDALNVLIAANVLKKVNKNVYYNESGFFNFITTKKEMASAQEVKHRREHLLRELDRKEVENFKKKLHLKDLLTKLFAVKNLIKKNKVGNRNRFVSFPFMLASPSNCSDSHVTLTSLKKIDRAGNGTEP